MNALPKLLVGSFEEYPGPFSNSSGWLKVLGELAEHFEIDVICSCVAPQPSYETSNQARFFRLPLSPSHSARSLEDFERQVRTFLQFGQYDLIHALDPVMGNAVCRLPRHRRPPTVYDATFFEQGLLAQSARNPAWEERHDFCLKEADQTWLGCEPSSRLSLLKARPPILALPDIRKHTRPIQPNRIHLASFGAPSLQAQLEVPLLALKKLSLSHAFHWTLFCHEPPITLQEMAKHLNLLDFFTFQAPPSPAQVPEALTRFDAGWLFEGSTSLWREWLAAGCLLIAPDSPAHRATLPSQATCFYSGPQPEPLATSLHTLCRVPAFRVAATLFAHQWAHEHLSAPKVAHQLGTLYKETLSRHLVSTHLPLNGSAPSKEGLENVDPWMGQLAFGYCPPASPPRLRPPLPTHRPERVRPA